MIIDFAANILRSKRGRQRQISAPLLLYPPTAIRSRQTIRFIICPACKCVHEIGGTCISRHRHSPTPATAVNNLPRGLFFQSLFFSRLNTTSFSYSSPIVGSTAVGNSNPLELHSRTIQQLVAANLTLAAAWTWLEELCRNESGSVTSFPLAVTHEIYTLGFDAMVLNVLPNVTVENSGNSSVPPPPVREPEWWEAAWNTFTGVLSAAWNAVVAVATFIANVAVAIANGEGLEFFYNTAVKPFVEAVLAFIKFIWNLIVEMMKVIMKPIADWITAKFRCFATNIMTAAVKAETDMIQHGYTTPQTNQTVWWALFDSGGSSLFSGLMLGVIIATVSLSVGFMIGLIVCPVLEDLLAAALIIAWTVGILAMITLILGETTDNIISRDYSGTPIEQASDFFLGLNDALPTGILAGISLLISGIALAQSVSTANEDPTGWMATIIAFVYSLVSLGLAVYFLSAGVSEGMEKNLALFYGIFALAGIWLGTLALVRTFLPGFGKGPRIVSTLAIVTGTVGVFVAIAKLKEG